MDELEQHRDTINQIDEQIFDLIKIRMDVSKKIGSLKAIHSIPIRDPSIEVPIIEKYRKRAGELGAQISQLLINASCAVQEHKQSITLIGGQGSMGKWANHYLSSRGHRILIIEKEDLLDSGIHSDVIVLATPIDETVKIIEKLTNYQVKGLVVDLASLKDPLIPVIETAKRNGIKIASIHPMFGPDIESLVNQSILVCGDDEGVGCLFDQTCVKLISIPIKEHDHVICYISALTHLINYLFAGTLSYCDFDNEAGSISFRQQLNVAKRVFNSNPELYYQLLIKNSSANEMINHIEKLLKTYQKISYKDFSELFKSGKMRISQ